MVYLANSPHTIKFFGKWDQMMARKTQLVAVEFSLITMCSLFMLSSSVVSPHNPQLCKRNLLERLKWFLGVKQTVGEIDS